jgi:hypothetical protein
MSLTDTNALTTVTQVETDLGITPGSETAKLEELILTVSELIESRTNRQFRKEEVTEQLPGLGTELLVVARTPIDITADITVTYDGDEVDATNYKVVTDDAQLGFIRYVEGVWTWTARALPNIGYDLLPGSERKLYEVTYTGGYVLPNDTVGTRSLPRDLELACRQFVAQLYHSMPRDPTIKSEKVLSAAFTYFDSRSDASDSDGDLPSLTRSAVKRYRRIT